ncbi:hypothetical protein Bbelb_244340 [Branchiostoma belcheri]|nr:hypothetical protein Bbelb_244340 [Branchiostoma belcheri]
MSRAKTFFGRRRQELFAELNSQRQTGEFVDMVMMILDFVYTGQITISQDDVKDILQAAHKLKLKKIKKYCLEFMHRRIQQSNCLFFLHLANLYGFSDLKDVAKTTAVHEFWKASQYDGFLTLSSDELVDLLRTDLLKVTSEDEVTTSVIQWLDHDPDSRKQALPTILQEIHLSCVHVSVLRELESHPAVLESAECLAKVTAAKEEHLNGTSQLTAGAEGGGAKPKRKPPASDGLTIIVGGWKVEQPIPLKSVICLEPDDQHCYHITDLPIPALGYTSVANAGRHLYISGGCLSPMTRDGSHTSAPIKQAFCYDLLTDAWTQLPDMPRGRAEHQSVVVDGKLFLVGGDVEAASDEAASIDMTGPLSIDCYDLQKGTWIKPPTIPPINPSSKWNFKVASCGGKLVLVEGEIKIKESRETLCVHALDVPGREWTYSDISWGPAVYSSSSNISVDISVNAIDDKVYVCAYTRYGTLLFAYDVKTESLTMVKSAQASRSIKFLCTTLFERIDLPDDVPLPEGTMDATRMISIYDHELSFVDKVRRADGHIPFAVFGCSVLRTKKSSIGWYCRDRHAIYVNDDKDVIEMRPGHRCRGGLKRPDPSTRTVRFKNDDHSRDLGDKLVRQCNTGTYADVVLEVEGRKVRCHRAVLASTPYFKTMFSCSLKESNSRVVKLCGIDFNSLRKILTFLYKGSIQISGDNVQEILQAAHMLQIDEITEFCRSVIRDNIHACNCIGVMRLANLYGFSDLEEEARREAVTQFSEVRQDEEFLSLSTAELVDLLGDDCLKVTSEDEVVTSVVRWLDHDPESRKTSMPAILQKIRLPYVKVSMLEKLESHPGVLESAECLAKITAVKQGHLTGKLQLLEYEHKRSGRSDDMEITVGGWRGRAHYWHYVQAIPLESIICRDPDDQHSFHITKLPTAVSGYMSVARAERHLYVTGGRTHPLVGQGPHSAPSRQAFRYDFPEDTWTQLPDMTRGRAGHQSVVVGGKLFLVGGDTDDTPAFSMDCYDLEEDAWINPAPTLPEIDPSSTLRLVDTSSNHVVLIEIPTDTKECTTKDVLRRVLGWNLKVDRKQLIVHVLNTPTAPLGSDDDEFALTDDNSSLLDNPHSKSNGQVGRQPEAGFSQDNDKSTENDDDFAAILRDLPSLNCKDNEDAYDGDDEKEEEEEDKYDENEQWTRSDILLLYNLDGHDIYVISVNDKVYFHFVPAKETGQRNIHHVQVYNVKEKTTTDLLKVGGFSHSKRGFGRYYYVFDRFSDAIINHKFQDMAIEKGEASTSLFGPGTSLFGQSVLTVDKRGIGWYCRDLEKFENVDKPNQSPCVIAEDEEDQDTDTNDEEETDDDN